MTTIGLVLLVPQVLLQIDLLLIVSAMHLSSAFHNLRLIHVSHFTGHGMLRMGCFALQAGVLSIRVCEIIVIVV